VTAFVLAQIPNAYVSPAITADEFALIGMNGNIVYRVAVVVITLHSAGLGIPNLDCAVLRASDHPFRVAVEANAGDVVCVALKD